MKGVGWGCVPLLTQNLISFAEEFRLYSRDKGRWGRMTSLDLYFKEITLPDLNLRGQEVSIWEVPWTSEEGSSSLRRESVAQGKGESDHIHERGTMRHRLHPLSCFSQQLGAGGAPAAGAYRGHPLLGEKSPGIPGPLQPLLPKCLGHRSPASYVTETTVPNWVSSSKISSCPQGHKPHS